MGNIGLCSVSGEYPISCPSVPAAATRTCPRVQRDRVAETIGECSVLPEVHRGEIFLADILFHGSSRKRVNRCMENNDLSNVSGKKL